MKKKILLIFSALIILFSTGFVYMTQFHSSTGLDRKEEKIIKHGFRLLEEQIGTYIKENYSGISKIEFSPIFIQGGKDNPPFTADVLPVIYDKEGNRAVMGKRIGKKGYPTYGTTGDLTLDFDQMGNENIFLKGSSILDEKIDVSSANHLPEEAKLTPPIKGTDDNIDALVNDGQLKNVNRSENGSPNAKMDYNLEIKRGSYSEWEQWSKRYFKEWGMLMMKKKFLTILALILVLVSGGIFVYNKLTKPNFGPKTTRLYQHGFQLLEEQIATYIKEHYKGIKKIEFSPIYVTGDDGSSMLNAEIVPIIYDYHGNKAKFGGLYKNFQHPAYGTIGYLRLSFDYSGKPYIELSTDTGEFKDVTYGQSLPEEIKGKKIKDIDFNFETLIKEERLKGVEKSDVGSPNAEVIYNLELKKGVLPHDTEW